MIPDDVVERVRNEADVVALIGEFVRLKRVGSSFRGPCPFHHGTNPNFSVNDRGYNCFVCGESGDVFTFVQKHLGLSFVEAVKWVGAKEGIEVQDVSRRPEEVDARQPVWELNATAAEFFHTELWESDEGRVARDYLASRGISRADADRFGLGYAPRDSSTMRGALRALGFEDDRQLAANLLRPKQDKPEEYRAQFRGRLMIPIHDVSGHVVGFGGRILTVGEPKYLNSPDSDVFQKRTLLYGLNWAKQAVRKAERLIIVEGYFDVIRLMLAGIEDVVAPMGTALTEQQANLIKKYTKSVLLLYDSDPAGLKATFKSGDALLATGISARVMTLPDGEDPDTFVAKEGVSGFEHAASQAVDVFERRVQILERSGWFGDIQHKRKALDKLMPTIRLTTDALLRDLYITRTADVSGVPRETIVREVAAAPAVVPRWREAEEPREAPQLHVVPDRQALRPDPRTPGVKVERELVRVLLHQRQFADFVSERIGGDTFLDPVYRAIFNELVTQDHDAPMDQIEAGLDEQATLVMQELLNERGGLDHAEASVRGSVGSMLARPLNDRIEEIQRSLPLADAAGQTELIREKQRLVAERGALTGGRWPSLARKRP